MQAVTWEHEVRATKPQRAGSVVRLVRWSRDRAVDRWMPPIAAFVWFGALFLSNLILSGHSFQNFTITLLIDVTLEDILFII